MGRSGHSALIIGISATAVLAAGIGVSVTRGDGPAARAETTLGPVRDASVVSVNGESLPAHAGTILAPGDVITTGPDGNAALLTRGRITYLTSNAVLAVRDGAHQQLRTGTAVIDAQEGPGLTLDIAGDTLVVPSGSATEADRGTAVRIGSLAGPASVTNGSGRQLSVAALWQVIVNGDALPNRSTPLQLSNVGSVRDAEASAVPELVSDNLAMQALARGINSTGSTTAHAVEIAWTGTLVQRSAGVTRSDQVLPAVIADATPHAGGTAQERYDRVVGWRAEGGSWGVVIHLLSARAAQIADTLRSLQQSEHSGTVGNISANGLRVPPIRPASSSNDHSPGPAISPPVTLPTHPTKVPPTGGGPAPKPTPTPTPTVLGGIVHTVGSVLNDLISLLPSHSPTAKSHVLQQTISITSTTASSTSTVVPTTTAVPTTTTVPTTTDPTQTPTSGAVPTQPETPAPAPTISSLVDDLLGGVASGLSGQ